MSVKTVIKQFAKAGRCRLKIDPSDFSRPLSSFLIKRLRLPVNLFTRKPTAALVPQAIINSTLIRDPNYKASLPLHLMHRNCFGIDCTVREWTLPRWAGQVMKVVSVESSKGARMADIRVDVYKEGVKDEGGLVKRRVKLSRVDVLGGKWTVVE